MRFCSHPKVFSLKPDPQWILIKRTVCWCLKPFEDILCSTNMIWDVIWGQTNPFLILDRPPNTISLKDQLSKNWILSSFWPSQKASHSTSKVLSKESHPQVKNLENFFRKLDLSEFSSDFNDYYMKKHLF